MLINAYYRFYICITDDLYNKCLLKYYFKNLITKHCPIEQGKWRKKSKHNNKHCLYILGWPKSWFGVFCKLVWKNPHSLFGQASIMAEVDLA